jgi:hypothetical protein
VAKLTSQEKQRRREEQSAARKNAQLRAAAPLFADLLPEHTPEGEHRHWRRNKALAAERVAYLAGSRILDELQVCQAIRPYAASLVGPEAFAKLDAYCQRVYPSRAYWYGFWRDVLTGKRIEFKLERVENRRPGQPALICTDWYQHQHMSQEEFYARFPFKTQPPLDSGFEGAVLVEEILATRTDGLHQSGERPAARR